MDRNLSETDRTDRDQACYPHTTIPTECSAAPVSIQAAGGASALNLTGLSGQACYYFSNGCQTGCDACDGATRGPVPKFIFTGDEIPGNWDVWAVPGVTSPS